MTQYTIGFIGTGNMATSLIGGLVADGYPPGRIWSSDVNQERLQVARKQLGIHTCTDNLELVEHAEVLVLAVKPQTLASVCRQIREGLGHQRPLTVSIAAGVRTADLQQWLGENIPIVRCMPNTPALVQSGATALYATPRVNETQRDMAESILRAVGLTVWLQNESLMDPVTAISGSGPAYFFLLMEAMEAVAVDMGLDPATARLLIQQTALGAAKVAIEVDDSPADLRHRVTSPGGTTEQAISVFEDGDFRTLVGKALRAACARSIELSSQLGKQS